MPPSVLHLRARRYHLPGVGPKIWMQQVISKADHFDLAATLWSEYKHQYTFKVLVAITPNGAISYVSSC